MSDVPIRAFISHSSEDKDRFVRPFVKKLFENGIEAWVDEWEIQPGDSLVQRIFNEGISDADAFIIVLSHISVQKPWVREELDLAVVKRIQSELSLRLIPIVLDAGVEIPAPLLYLLHLSVPQAGFDGVVEEVVNHLHGVSSKPVLGRPPRYQSTPLLWTTDAADETVFNLIADKLRSHNGPGWTLFSNDVEERANAMGISSEAFHESMHILVAERLVNAQVMAGGVRWLIKPFSDSTWLGLQANSGVDTKQLKERLLALIVNDDETKLNPDNTGIDWFTLGALLRELKYQHFVEFSVINGGEFWVTAIHPTARRALRQGTLG